MPPTAFWRWGPWLWVLLLVIVLPTAVIVGILLNNGYAQLYQHWDIPALYTLLSAVLLWGSYVFTGVVTNAKLNQMIRYCYGFTLAVVVLSIVPFSIPEFFSKPSDQAPINIVRGCASVSNGAISDEISCAKSALQWIVNVGGVISPKPEATPAQYEVSGGVAGPLFVVVLALFGSAVSMTRRVPEFQRRAIAFTRSDDKCSGS